MTNLMHSVVCLGDFRDKYAYLHKHMFKYVNINIYFQYFRIYL